MITKLFLAVTLLIVVGVGTVTFLSLRREQRGFRSELEQQAQIMLDSFSITAASPLQNLRMNQLAELVAGLDEVPIVRVSRFYDSQGRVLAETGGDQGKRFEIDPHGQRLLAAGRTLFDLRGDQLVAGQVIRAGDTKLGAMSLALSTEGFREKVTAVRNQGLVVALAALLVGTLLSLGLARSVNRPLQEILAATERITCGDLKQRVAVDREDELGALATAFDQMTVELKAAQENLLRRQRLATMGELAGSIGHEIRGPLAAMRRSLCFLARHFLDGAQARQHLGLIKREVHSANRIISELLDYARASTAEKEGFSLQKAVDGALAGVTVPDSVVVQRRSAPQPVRVEADRAQITRALNNLLDNALRAMAGVGTLTVDCYGRDTDALVAITDTGEGLTEGQLTQLREPLRTGQAKGIGLGLSLAQHYAQLNGGWIKCHSRPGKGATFRLRLPLAVGAPTVEASAAAEDSSRPVGVDPKGPGTGEPVRTYRGT